MRIDELGMSWAAALALVAVPGCGGTSGGDGASGGIGTETLGATQGDTEASDADAGSATAGDDAGEGDGASDGASGGDGDGDAGETGAGESGPGVKWDVGPPEDDAPCRECSGDYLAVLDCTGSVVESCDNGTGCDPGSHTCIPACDLAEQEQFSVGCEYLPVRLDSYASSDRCFAAFVSNPWNVNAHIDLEWAGSQVAVENYAYIPNGTGPSLTYTPYDASVGIAPGGVAILMLSGAQGTGPRCPFTTVDPSGSAHVSGTGKGSAFRIESDVPVVAYQISPFGGGSAAVTGASLLLPTSAWNTDYIAAAAYAYDIGNPTVNVVASVDNTTVTMWPNANITAGGAMAAGTAGQPYTFTLNAGEHAQVSQTAELTGSVLVADQPVGMLAGQTCLRIPVGIAYCDHAEEMIPPVSALGSEYAGVMHQPRGAEPSAWRIIGAVDGTTLTWSSAVGGPATLNAGQVVEFTTAEAFVVASQDDAHPFMLMNYMSGSQWSALGSGATGGYGDPEVALSVPTGQYLRRYVFFADPTYPETSLTVVRRAENGTFEDVNLDCAGVISGWTPLSADLEWTRVQLIEGNFQNVGSCSTGAHEISSDAPFGIWVWGWGTPETSTFTENVSYGYPGGMNVATINSIDIQPPG